MIGTYSEETGARIYGPENPLLDQHAGYSFVTLAAFESPVFRVLLDLLDHKRVAAGSLDLAKTAARYTLSVAEAAERLGIRDSAVRTADNRGPAAELDEGRRSGSRRRASTGTR